MPNASTPIKDIYTDGACSGNPGPGGWGARIEFSDGEVQELGGADPATTNNRMEMQAAIAALEYLQEWEPNATATLHTDSQYVIKGITQWIKGWKRKGWKTAQGKPVLNQDLWQILDQLNSIQIQWRHVKGHAGNPGNERCDAIATGFAAGRSPRLAQRSPRNNGELSSQSAIKGKEPQKSKENPQIFENLAENHEFSEDEHTKSKKDAIALENTPSNVEEQAINSMDHESSQSYESSANFPREARVAQVRNMVDTLNMADEIADKGFLISSSELADLMDVNASAVTSRGEQWVWRNWVVSRVRREGNQILWQLERVD